MSKKSNIKTTILFVLSISLIVTAITTYLLTVYYRQVCFHILGRFCESLIENNPDSKQTVLEILKTHNVINLRNLLHLNCNDFKIRYAIGDGL